MRRFAIGGAAAAALGAALGAPAMAQERLDAAGNPVGTGYAPPRLASGAPDLEGVWTNASLTPMSRNERSPYRSEIEVFDALVIDPAAVEAINENSWYVATLREDNEPTPPGTGPGDGVGGGDVKGYNNFWIDPGESYALVNGTYRSSWIVEPDDGRVPYSEEGRQARAAARRALYEGGGNTGPEQRTLGDRCLISGGHQAGPPLNNTMYNNHYQIVQTPDHVMILTEMNHDARIVRLDAEHRPAQMRPWFGDSVGWYEGDSLVVETVNIHPAQEQFGYVPISADGKITERFTRIAEDEIFYEFEVEDPSYYAQAWRGEMALRADEDKIYEYACHEGNYAMEGILRGMLVDLEGSALGQGEGD